MAVDGQVRSFLRERIGSVWALDLLLLLRSQPARIWTCEALATELRANPTLVRDNARRLKDGELVLEDGFGRYHYAPADARLSGLVEQTAAAYRERPVAIISLISAPRDPLPGLAALLKPRSRT